MAWVWLLAAGALEIVWAVGLKVSHGLSKPGPAVLTVACMLLSFLCLARAVAQLPVGTAYAVWTGIGATGTAIIGMVWLGEPRDAWRLVSLALTVLGVLGLKLASR